MKLTIKKAFEEDVYRDIVRIPEKYRKNRIAQTIPDGTLLLSGSIF